MLAPAQSVALSGEKSAKGAIVTGLPQGYRFCPLILTGKLPLYFKAEKFRTLTRPHKGNCHFLGHDQSK